MSKWYKGNIHTHTNESDGDSDPKTVVNFFVEANYDFLVLSDHNHVTVLDYEEEKNVDDAIADAESRKAKLEAQLVDVEAELVEYNEIKDA